ncbi:MAG: hypothetical protein LC777_19880 [Actinobacteria bacterium]|nr:hypothetical protein [Actinomycetota bacterium]
MQRARERVRELTARDRLRWPVEQVVQDLNRFLRGWAGYFRYGNSTVQFDQIVKHADRRLALLLAHRHQRSWWYGRKLLNSRPDRYGRSVSTKPLSRHDPTGRGAGDAECRR